MFINLEDALVIVLELAQQSVLDEGLVNSPELEAERERQLEACRVVEDHIVNHYSVE